MAGRRKVETIRAIHSLAVLVADVHEVAVDEARSVEPGAWSMERMAEISNGKGVRPFSLHFILWGVFTPSRRILNALRMREPIPKPDGVALAANQEDLAVVVLLRFRLPLPESSSFWSLL